MLLNILVTAASGYAIKVAYEALATPLTYAVVNGLKRAEGLDVYDEGTDFNPFARGDRRQAPSRRSRCSRPSGSMT